MLVISDTGPLRYLIEIDAVDVLPVLYGAQNLLTTPEVIGELCLPHFPVRVRNWAASPPTWLKIESPLSIDFLDRLDSGEASALSLARERSAELVLIDERDGTTVARGIGLETYGTLGVIALAGARRKLDFEKTLDALANTRFRKTSKDLDRVRELYADLQRDFDQDQKNTS